MAEWDSRAPVDIRLITPNDDGAVASIIRDVMTEFDCTGCGYAIHDSEVEHMSAAYAGASARFFVVEQEATVVGCGGFAPLAGVPPSDAVCELRKMYFRPSLRGLGIGRRLLRLLLDEMRTERFRRCYLETTSRMTAAQSLYRKTGFRELDQRLGNTGHHSCDRFYVIDL